MGSCPSCRAAVKPGAPWCTLCYADLRPAPPTPPQPPQLPQVLPEVQPATDLRPVGLLVPAQAGRHSAGDLPATTAAGRDPLGVGTPDPLDVSPGADAAAEPTWPCTACGAQVALDLDSCPACGTGFLAAARDDALVPSVPLLGDPRRASRVARLGWGAGVGMAAMLVLLLLGAVVGLFL